MTNEELAISYSKGNNAAFDLLLERVKGEVFSYILVVVRNKELAEDNLSKFIEMKFNSPQDAIQLLNLNIPQIRQQYLDLQHELYNGEAVKAISVQGDLHVHGDAQIGTYNQY